MFANADLLNLLGSVLACMLQLSNFQICAEKKACLGSLLICKRCWLALSSWQPSQVLHPSPQAAASHLITPGKEDLCTVLTTAREETAKELSSKRKELGDLELKEPLSYFLSEPLWIKTS